ncbi:MAG: tryptophan synthase subunit alpha, partial [Alphaproteobacteria bacterium]|nr:tryptophan synthase subunit alpha [Alphaproteobacteria bacterium]
GTASAEKAEIQNAVAELRKHTDLPIAVGFGIKTADQASDIAGAADAVVVGSALIDRIASGVENKAERDEIISSVHGFVSKLAIGLRKE